MKNIFAIVSATFVVVLLMVMPVSAQTPAHPPAAPPPPQTFSGLVQSVDAYSGTVSVHGPKPAATTPGTPSGSAGKTPMFVTRTFGVDKTATVSVAGKPKATLADVKNGDQVQVNYIVTPGGQFLVKSVTDSGPPPPKKPAPAH